MISKVTFLYANDKVLLAISLNQFIEPVHKLLVWLVLSLGTRRPFIVGLQALFAVV